MTYGRIRRGPMAADAFTQIRNALFRDARLSAKAKGIFGFISTHRDGWGVTPESIAASMTDGVSAIRSGLRELEALGYLVREQPRRPDGTMGSIEYYITDRPSSEPVDGKRQPASTSKNEQNRRSEPVEGFPHAVEPQAADRPHKKTIPLGKKISGEKTTSSSPTGSSSDVPAVVAGVTEGGGGGGPLDESRSTAEYIAGALDYRGKVPDRQQRQKLTDLLAAALKSGWTMDGLALYLDLGEARVDSPAAVYAHRLHPDRLPAAEPVPAPLVAAGGVRGPVSSAAEIESATLEDVFGTGQPAVVGAWEAAEARARQRLAVGVRGGTDGRMDGWDEVARKLGGHQSYSNDAWSAPAIAAEAAKIPWCGDVECEPGGRLREHIDEKGFKTDHPCEKCHPRMQWA
jgi:hypothetical protein